jgi:hypothetical protein
LEYDFPLFCLKHLQGGQLSGHKQQHNKTGKVNNSTIKPKINGPTNIPNS